jgi:two-component system, LytTR family, sensor kinase
MTRKQLLIAYAAIIFMMVFGFDLINAIKFREPVHVSDVFTLLNLSQIIYAGVTLLLTRWVFQKYYVSKKYLALAVGIVGLLVFFIVFRYTLEEILYPLVFKVRNYRANVSLIYYSLDNLYYGITYIVLGVMVFFADDMVGQRRKQVMLEQQNRNAELQFLRSQVNPHFLFNSLNNIYSLAHEGSPRTPQAVLKLSELIRYMLYEKKEKVSLVKEWEYIQNFIALNQLRFETDFPVKAILEGAAEGKEIAPYLLIPFAENAFKHADFKDRNTPLIFRLKVNEDQIIFESENKIGAQNKEEAGGVGLDNVKKRLELIYPGRHHLSIDATNGTFKAQLYISE